MNEEKKTLKVQKLIQLNTYIKNSDPKLPDGRKNDTKHKAKWLALTQHQQKQ